MNLLLRILTVGSLLVATHAFAADAFEGKVSLTISSGSNGKPMNMNYSMKGQKLRTDMEIEGSESGDESDQASREHKKKSNKLLPGFLGGKKSTKSEENDSPAATGSGKPHQISSITDMEKMEMITLMPEQNMYMVMPIKKTVEKVMEKQGEVNSDVEKTGKTETIAGYKTEQIIITDKDKGTVTEVWLATDLKSTFMGLGNPHGGGGPFGGRKNAAAAAKWEEVLKGKGGFPLRVITRDAKGKETFKMEATKVEPSHLPDSMFLPPPEFQKFEMPDLGGLNPFKRD